MCTHEEVGLVAEAFRSVLREMEQAGAAGTDLSAGAAVRVAAIRVGRVVCGQAPGETDRFLIASGVGRKRQVRDGSAHGE